MRPSKANKHKEPRWKHKALVLGRIGIVRSLGREGVPVTVAREAPFTFERVSRYCHEYIPLPNLEQFPDDAIDILEQYGSRQENKPVVFLNSESDVLLISRYRKRLSTYYHIVLADDDLINQLIDKGKFNTLAEECNLPVPKTIVVDTKEECFLAAEKIGYPCILKPIRQRLWHNPQIVASIGGYHKALLLKNHEELIRLLETLPFMTGEMIQEYIPGNDQQIFEFHSYSDTGGIPRGYLVGHKIRMYPIHFGMGSYTQFVEEPKIAQLCLEMLKKIGYTGAADIDLKRHAVTGKDYILEINPRFSLWTIITANCSVNLPMLQYREALGLDVPDMEPSGQPRRWLWLGADFKSMLAYRKSGELTFWKWLKSFFLMDGKIEFHIFSWDDPLPFFVNLLMTTKYFFSRIWSSLARRLG